MNTTYAGVPDRLHLACLLASLARISGHPSVFATFRNAMSLVQSSLSFAPTLQIQHARLAAVQEISGTMPLEYASYLIHTGRLMQAAIEILEQGRAFLWSEMHGLRISVDQVRVANVVLAEKFAAINRELETLTTSTAPSRNIATDGGGIKGRQGMDSFGCLVVKQLECFDERNRTVGVAIS
jgi:hypothetical protein